MCKQLSSKPCAVGIAKMLRNATKLVFAWFVLGANSGVNAVPLDPLPGYLSDTGVNYFTPGIAAVGIELLDPLEPFTSFGFYYKSDASTLIDIFDSGDLINNDPVANPQVSLVDFVGGILYDIDINPGTPTLEGTFTVLPDDIGFFLSINSTNIFSDPLLNGGLDLFSAWRNEADPTLWGLAFEGVNPDGSTSVINISLVGGITVPEPSVTVLMALGVPFVLLGSHRRRKKALTV
jgi:hypothetical protein